MASKKITRVDGASRSFVDGVDESLTCGICRFVYRAPVRFPCGNAHAFCASCVEGWFDACVRTTVRRDLRCPCCRGTARESGEMETVADEIAARLEAESAACGCGAHVRLAEAAVHYATCPLTKDLVVPWARVVRRPRVRVRRGGGGEAAGAGAGADADADADADEWFACMFCFADHMARDSVADLDAFMQTDFRRPSVGDDAVAEFRKALEMGVFSINAVNNRGRSARDRMQEFYDYWVEGQEEMEFESEFQSESIPAMGQFLHRGMMRFADHIITCHEDDEDAHKGGVCPICVRMPHGDPSRTVADIHAHVSRRHGFDWTLYMPDVHADEYELLEQTMRESLNAARANDANAEER